MIHWSWLFIIVFVMMLVAFFYFSKREAKHLKALNTVLETLARHENIIQSIKVDKLDKIKPRLH